MNRLFFSFALLFIASCTTSKFSSKSRLKKNVVSHSAPCFEGTFGLPVKPGYGNFNFQEFHTIDSIPLGISFLGSFWDARTRTNLPVNAEAIIGGITLKQSPDLLSHEYHLSPVNSSNDVFGKKISFQVKVLSDTAFTITDSVYIPQRPVLNFPGYDPPVALGQEIQGSVLSANQTLHWNADSQNKAGVYLLLEYVNKDTTVAYTCVLVDDNGSFTPGANFFKDVPNKAVVQLTIARGVYVVFKGPGLSGKDIMLHGFSRQQLSFRYVQ